MALMDLFLRGSLPHLSGMQALLFYGGATLLLGGPMMVGFGITHLRRRFLTPPLYDQQAVARKTAQMAYRSRLRLYVFGPGQDHSLCHTFCRYTVLGLWRAYRWIRSAIMQHPKEPCLRQVCKLLRRGWRIGWQ